MPFLTQPNSLKGAFAVNNSKASTPTSNPLYVTQQDKSLWFASQPMIWM